MLAQFSLEYYLWDKKISMNFNKTADCGNLPENGHEVFISYITATLAEGQVHLSWYQNIDLSSLYHHTKFERNRSVYVWKQANVKVCLMNHISWVLSLEYWINEIK